MTRFGPTGAAWLGTTPSRCRRAPGPAAKPFLVSLALAGRMWRPRAGVYGIECPKRTFGDAVGAGLEAFVPYPSRPVAVSEHRRCTSADRGALQQPELRLGAFQRADEATKVMPAELLER